MRLPGLTAAIVLLTLGAAGCGRREAPAPTAARSAGSRVILQTDWFPQAEHGGYYQALAKGYYKDAGLAVEILPGGPGAGIKLKVARGDADFGMDRSDNLILANGSGMPLVVVAATMQHDPQGLMVHAESPVKTFQDLDGRVVIGNVGMAWFPYLERKYGIKIERRQNTYGIGEFLANPELIQQCLITSEPFFAQQQGRRVRTLALAASGYDCYQALFTRRDFLRRSPELVRAFVSASIRGWHDYLKNDPMPAHELILQRNAQMTRELLAFSRGELIRGAFVQGDPAQGEEIGRISLARMSEQMDTLVSLKIMEAPLPVTTLAISDLAAKVDRPPEGPQQGGQAVQPR